MYVVIWKIKMWGLKHCKRYMRYENVTSFKYAVCNFKWLEQKGRQLCCKVGIQRVLYSFDQGKSLCIPCWRRLKNLGGLAEWGWMKLDAYQWALWETKEGVALYVHGLFGSITLCFQWVSRSEGIWGKTRCRCMGCSCNNFGANWTDFADDLLLGS